MLAIVFQPVAAFADRRPMSSRYPPEAIGRSIHFFEPFLALAEYADMLAGIDILP